jgi:putative aminopeptidase FrvX
MPPRKPPKRAKKPAKPAPRRPKATAKSKSQAKGQSSRRPAARSERRAPAPAGVAASTARPPEFVERLRQLSEAMGVSGDESAVRKIVLEAIAGHVDEVRTDTLGNILAVKKGTADRPARVMLAAHMDEVGLMIVGLESDGTLRFEAVGGVDDRVLLGQPVIVGHDRLPGIIGAKPVHVLTEAEEKQVVKIDAMRIDIGVSSREAAASKVRLGDRATFATKFAWAGDTVRGKALDDRTGCTALIEILRGKPFPFDLWAAFTVQEEIGLRGARVAAYAADPLVAFVLEGTVCDDMPKEDDVSPTTELGKGPALSLMDRGAIADRRLADHLVNTAQALGIPYQVKQPGVGATDAGSIHLARAGVPSVALAVPCRYIHAPAALMNLADFRNEITLLRAALERFTPAVLRRKG